jgi:hypothetical protein
LAFGWNWCFMVPPQFDPRFSDPTAFVKCGSNLCTTFCEFVLMEFHSSHEKPHIFIFLVLEFCRTKDMAIGQLKCSIGSAAISPPGQPNGRAYSTLPLSKQRGSAAA